MNKIPVKNFQAHKQACVQQLLQLSTTFMYMVASYKAMFVSERGTFLHLYLILAS